MDADPGFFRYDSFARVGALGVWRSRPAVALRVRLRASPSAQDDTYAGKVGRRGIVHDSFFGE